MAKFGHFGEKFRQNGQIFALSESFKFEVSFFMLKLNSSSLSILVQANLS
jgi:hypothetical protein